MPTSAAAAAKGGGLGGPHAVVAQRTCAMTAKDHTADARANVFGREVVSGIFFEGMSQHSYSCSQMTFNYTVQQQPPQGFTCNPS